MDNKNNIVVCVPDDIEKIEKGIKALEHQIIMDNNEYDRKIHQYALSCPKMGCGRVFPIGRVKRKSDFSVVIDKYRRFK